MQTFFGRARQFSPTKARVEPRVRLRSPRLSLPFRWTRVTRALGTRLPTRDPTRPFLVVAGRPGCGEERCVTARPRKRKPEAMRDLKLFQMNYGIQIMG